MTVADSQPRTAPPLETAAQALRRGHVVVYPTETLYGLGADATSAAAVDRLLRLKGGREGKPISVLVADRAMAERVGELSPLAARLAAHFWPGPLTLVVRARADLPAAITAGTGTVALRVSSHPVAACLVAALGRPLTTPSANPSDQPPPRDIATARRYFGGAVACYLDGGTLPGGASTLVETTGGHARILRAGAIGRDVIADVVGEVGG
jgi:L-threonylcarbamoyladenylate synthase